MFFLLLFSFSVPRNSAANLKNKHAQQQQQQAWKKNDVEVNKGILFYKNILSGYYGETQTEIFLKFSMIIFVDFRKVLLISGTLIWYRDIYCILSFVGELTTCFVFN